MTDTTYTLYTFLQQYNIEIPIIQRDYAQGRKTKKAADIRNNLLQSIKEAVVDKDRSLDFDFIFGRIEPDGKRSKMIPIDGQQRLTTLLLLYWYAACKKDRLIEVRNNLSNFSYKIRPSSERFLKYLMGNNLENSGIKSRMSTKITNESWFCHQWKLDPTVQGMLEMLDSIHSLFSDVPGLFDCLYNENRITFQFKKMEELGLNDDVYIKMNSRGKPLTEFENFKAVFEKFLEEQDPTVRKEFSIKIDGVWTDFFWNYRAEFLIDTPFMNFFNFITGMLYYKKTNGMSQGCFLRYEEICGFSDWMIIVRTVYSKKENIKFLFSVIDNLRSRSLAKNWFDKVFSKNGTFPKVRLFIKEYNLLDECIVSSNIGGSNQLILYFLLIYISEHGLAEPDDIFLEKLRILRNFLLQERQFKWPGYTENFRYQNMQAYIMDAEKLYSFKENSYFQLTDKAVNAFTKSAVAHEIQKGRLINDDPKIKPVIFALEDLSVFKGNLSCITKKFESLQLTEIISVIKNVFLMIECPKVIKAMIKTGFCGQSFPSCSLGSRWFFGHEESWELFFTREESEIPIDLINLLIATKEIDYETTIDELISLGNKEFNDKKTWQYYFFKYPQILKNGSNLFAWRDDEQHFEIERISKWQAKSWHINPYIDIIIDLLNDDRIVTKDDCKSKTDQASVLRLKNGIAMTCKNEGWVIEIPNSLLIRSNELTSLQNNTYLLKDNSMKDRIESGIDFIRSYYPV